MAIKPQRYMKQPTYVEVMLVSPQSIGDVAKWVGGTVVDDPFYGRCVTLPKTKAPHNRAFLGQYVVRYASGLLSTVTADAFEETYIPA